MTSVSKLWQEDAEREFRNAQTLRSSDPLGAYLHLEKAVEKSVKALIVYHSSDSDPYDGPNKHDIGLLLRELRKRAGKAARFAKQSLENAVRNGTLQAEEAEAMRTELEIPGQLFSRNPVLLKEIEESIEQIDDIFPYSSDRHYISGDELPTTIFSSKEGSMQSYLDNVEEFLQTVRSHISSVISNTAELPPPPEEGRAFGGEAVSMMLHFYRENFPESFGQVSNGILLPDKTRNFMQRLEQEGTFSLEYIEEERSDWLFVPVKHRDGTEQIVVISLSSAQESYSSPEGVQYTFYTEWEDMEIREAASDIQQ